MRLAEPDWHREAMTSRPLFLTALATRTRHARQTMIRVTSAHAEAKPAAKALAAVAAFLRGPDPKCGAVDEAAKMAGDPIAGVPRVPQGPPVTPPASPHADATESCKFNARPDHAGGNCGF